MGTDDLDEHEPRKHNGDPPQFSDDEELTNPDIRANNWDRVFRMLRKITNEVNDIKQRVIRIELHHKDGAK